MNRVRAALLRLAPPWRRRHPVVLAHVDLATVHVNGTYPGLVSMATTGTVTTVDRNYAAEQDAAQQGGA